MRDCYKILPHKQIFFHKITFVRNNNVYITFTKQEIALQMRHFHEIRTLG